MQVLLQFAMISLGRTAGSGANGGVRALDRARGGQVLGGGYAGLPVCRSGSPTLRGMKDPLTQGAEHTTQRDYGIGEILPLVMAEDAICSGQLDLGFELGRGLDGDLEKASKLLGSDRSTPLDDVVDDGLGGTDHLGL